MKKNSYIFLIFLFVNTIAICQNSRLWATYYGNVENDLGNTVATDVLGNVYMAGNTFSPSGIASGGFQNTYGGQGDNFLVKFDAAGNRLWATYYGGALDEEEAQVTTDVFGNVYLAGYTRSTSGIASAGAFQTTVGGGGNYDAFLVKFNAAGTRLWATYYGGNGNDKALSISVDTAGNIYMAGITDGANGIASGGFQNTLGGLTDAFLVKFDAAGNRQWATYYGGTLNDYGRFVTTDIVGNVYLAGDTPDNSGIATTGAFQTAYGGATYDAFLVKFDATGNRQWATHYGGAADDYAKSVAIDVFGNIYI